MIARLTLISLILAASPGPDLGAQQSILDGAGAGQNNTAPAEQKWFKVKPLVNVNACFKVQLSVDAPDRRYAKGQKMTATVLSEAKGYLYLLYFMGDRAGVLFPNRYATNNAIEAKQEIVVPGPGAKFVLESEEPFGQGHLVAFVTLQPWEAYDQLWKQAGQDQDFLELSLANVQNFVNVVQQQDRMDWAECRLDVATCAQKEPGKPKRVAVCIGIGPYKNAGPGFDKLQSSDEDARRMGEALRKHCGVTDVVTLINEQATRAAIEQALFRDLPAKTQPGDTIFIYFSGHGWRVADTNGDEDDGFDEVLVPYDGQFGKPETMILDDEFARWMQELSGCEIGIILDCCYAGGAAKGIQQPSKGLGVPDPKVAYKSGLERHLQRSKALAGAKAVGQPGTMVLNACQENQLAWELPVKAQGSVFTYHLLQVIGSVAPENQAAQQKVLKNADTNRDGKISVGELFKVVKPWVSEFVKNKFQEEQTPVLLDYADDRIVVKP